ncbi:SAM-dependent methyltransferase [Gloeothece verrucosa]|uniref:SAM-dependent methyltransferase n=1 Tax=Gloeothece verrucosa (strain PCC 7822) TaxID=497965 RepID=E0UFK7_GLOV7|nr:SAM-dependent methyltransferase [Gloeothece verrucosa]ADN16701.1 SAM-dependent methyltransferase [Gloeothece verrucosa PCC 7822]
MSLKLGEIVPFGRSRQEYELMFNLSQEDYQQVILGCGDGPASFNAQMTQEGYSVISIDPIYQFSKSEIQQRFDEVVDNIIAQVAATPDNWSWSYHRDAEDLRQNRVKALEIFLKDYEQGRKEGRYQAAALPHLPFESGQFKLALCSHLLFLYSDLLSVEFHIESLKELCRVAQEVRIFPLLTLGRQVSSHIEPVREALAKMGIKSRIEMANYEFQKGGNQMLRLFQE